MNNSASNSREINSSKQALVTPNPPVLLPPTLANSANFANIHVILFGTVVKRGFVNHIPEALILQLEITPTMKSYVKRVLGHIKQIIKEEELPPIRVAKKKCAGGCGHKQICRI